MKLKPLKFAEETQKHEITTAIFQREPFSCFQTYRYAWTCIYVKTLSFKSWENKNQ